MTPTAEDTRPFVVQITLNQADHLSAAERQELVQAFQDNLQIILGGPKAMQATLKEQFARHDGANADSGADFEPEGTLRKAFIVADYTTWMGRNRPLGAHFGILFDRVTAN